MNEYRVTLTVTDTDGTILSGDFVIMATDQISATNWARNHWTRASTITVERA